MESEDTNGILDYPTTPPQPVGIYGWRKRCIYAFVLILMVVVIMNLALTVWILRVLDFSVDGMGRLKIVPKGFELQGEAEFLKPVYASKIKSEKNHPLNVMSKEFVEIMSVSETDATSSVVVGGDNIHMNCEEFTVRDLNGKEGFKIKDQKLEIVPSEAIIEGNIQFPGSVKTTSVLAEFPDNLELLANQSKVQIQGPEVNVQGDNITLQAEMGVRIAAERGNRILLLSENIFLLGPQMSTSPRPSPTSSSTIPEVSQLCVCKNGRLFLSSPSDNCHASTTFCDP